MIGMDCISDGDRLGIAEDEEEDVDARRASPFEPDSRRRFEDPTCKLVVCSMLRSASVGIEISIACKRARCEMCSQDGLSMGTIVAFRSA